MTFGNGIPCNKAIRKGNYFVITNLEHIYYYKIYNYKLC